MADSGTYCAYALVSETTGEIYIGQTNDLAERLAQHNDTGYASTRHTKRRRGPWRLIYSEECPTRAAAMKREKQLKCGAGRRLVHGLMQGQQDATGHASPGGC